MTTRALIKSLAACVLLAGALTATRVLQAATDPSGPPCEYTAAFTQTRTVDGIPVPLRSTGRLLVDCSLGLIWLTATPIQEALVYTRGDHHFRVQNGDQIEALDDLVNQSMAELLVPMLGGDLSALEDQFNIERTDNLIRLTPKQETLARFIREISIDQRSDGATVRLLDGRDMPTVIEVTDVQATGPSDLENCETLLGDNDPACNALLYPDRVAAGLVSDR